MLGIFPRVYRSTFSVVAEMEHLVVTSLGSGRLIDHSTVTSQLVVGPGFRLCGDLGLESGFHSS